MYVRTFEVVGFLFVMNECETKEQFRSRDEQTIILNKNLCKKFVYFFAHLCLGA